MKLPDNMLHNYYIIEHELYWLFIIVRDRTPSQHCIALYIFPNLGDRRCSCWQWTAAKLRVAIVMSGPCLSWTSCVCFVSMEIHCLIDSLHLFLVSFIDLRLYILYSPVFMFFVQSHLSLLSGCSVCNTVSNICFKYCVLYLRSVCFSLFSLNINCLH